MRTSTDRWTNVIAGVVLLAAATVAAVLLVEAALAIMKDATSSIRPNQFRGP